MKRFSMILVAMVLLAACSTAPAPGEREGDGTRLGGGAQGENPGNGKDKRKGKGGKGAEAPPGAPDSVDDADAAEQAAEQGQAPAAGGSGSGFASQGPPSYVDPALAHASSHYDDDRLDSQRQGVAPTYTEMTGAGVEGLGEDFRMTLEFAGDVPQATEDDKTYFVIGFAISPGGNEAYGFTAQCSQDGWRAYAGGKGEGTSRFPGKFTVEGNRIVMEVPWDFIGGPREFQWQANSSWFRSLANTTHYAFDAVPNKQPGRFPGD